MVSRAIPLAGFFSRDRIIVAGCIVLITALAWAYLLHLDQQMSAPGSMGSIGMAVQPAWTARAFFLTFMMWTVMMLGMMAPVAVPVLLLLGQMSQSRDSTTSSQSMAFFGLGHLAVWIAFSVVAASAQWSLYKVAMLSMNMSSTSPRLSGAILIAAGIYQLTPAKTKCLTRCQSPLGFLLTKWRDGPNGALQLGVRHGLYCVGCCWALMAVLFVVGVMNLTWVAALTVFVFVEKFGPGGVRIARAAGAMMIVLGMYFAVSK